MPIPPVRVLLILFFILALWPALHLSSTSSPSVSAQNSLPNGVPAIVFVSRAIPPNGTIYWNVPKDMPGVGPYSRFRVAAPGRLMVLEPNGSTRILVDGSNPSAANLNLMDVNAPDVSFDGKKIVFAGFTSVGFDPSKDTGRLGNPNAWRLYVINADGSGLRQLTQTDLTLNYSQFGSNAASGLKNGYDDTDPAWLPDGRIVFSSTRWPSYAQYSGVRASNLHVINADGSGMHRITAERNGADRPVVDPGTGQIVFARWWRNHRFATNNMATVPSSQGGYVQKDGLTMDRGAQLGGFDFLFRNNWHLAVINPDGTELAQWAGPHNRDDGVHAYGASFASNDELIANYFPMTNMSEAAGFGGLRRYRRRQTSYTPVLGITKLTAGNMVSNNPPSFGVHNGEYASDAAVLPDGRMVVSIAPDVNQDYALYLVDSNGQNRQLLYNGNGTTELRSKLLQSRPTPPIIADTVAPLTSTLPPVEAGPYDTSGTFVFDALNVYANGPVDSIDVSAPPVGSADKIRFFADFQRTNPGSFETLDWPILLGEKQVAGDGSVREPNAPAGIPLFEQIRSKDGTVPFTLGTPGGATHVAGMNFGMPGNVARCVGCHSGHTQIPVPATDEEAKWSNLAPGAAVTVSSTRDATKIKGLTDRKVMKGQVYEYWTSSQGTTAGQWVELKFPEAITVRNVRLYNPRFTNGSTVQVQATTVRLALPGVAGWVDTKTSGQLSPSGTDVIFPDVKAQTVRVEFGAVNGKAYDGGTVASLAEVEVIARAGAGAPSGAPIVRILAPASGAAVTAGSVSFQGTASDPQDGDISSKLVWKSSIAGEIGRGATFSANLAAGTHTISALATDSSGASGSSSLTLVVNAPGNNNSGGGTGGTGGAVPQVKILSPADGARLSGAITLQATANDAEDGDISAKISWHSNIAGVFARGASPTATLPAGTHRISALVADSTGKIGGALISVTVTTNPASNTTPTVKILSPANGAKMTGPVSFSASATDVEDGNLSANISWHSNISGVFGRGASPTATLPAGTHSISALVADSGGKTGGALITLTVGGAAAANAAPSIKILSPGNNASLTGVINFTGSATDPEDGDIASKISWHSNVIGVFGQGRNVQKALPAGTHRISALIYDSGGKAAGAVITITVLSPAAVNASPTIRILSPANGSRFTGAVSFSASATDAEEGNLSANISWRSNISGVFARGASPTATLPAGTHTITAQVADSGGKTAGAQITLTIGAAPAANASPSIKILAPGNNASVTGVVNFAGVATDPEDGDITSKISWHSNIVGIFGQGRYVQKPLPAGTHRISALIYDSGGKAAGAVITITVR